MSSIHIPGHTDKMLDRLLAYLGMDTKKRSVVLRIALAKGINSEQEYTLSYFNDTNGREVPMTAVCPNDLKVYFIQSIKQKHESNIEDSEINKLVRRYLIYGVAIMEDELNELDDLDNYLQFLIEKHQNEFTEVSNRNNINEILGY
ncbi:hypothetical protein [Salimicrobium flavidum]|uniref:Uncharacterized protein n=1 Tax=Salimicrobium flavidum TaxID=570947 RepID=A0A1N7KNX5_9BACI|nr:hypothetical protein [Salimicrobium flavidum]SIS63295.1 hypothetical protein SAMN05421687_1157 [Salimicrobium flavidum]